MKRILTLFLALCLLAALCACGGEDAPPAATEKPAPAPEPTPTAAPVGAEYAGLWAAPLDCIRLLELLSPDNAPMFGAGPAEAELLLELRADGRYEASVNYAPAIPKLRDGMFRYIEAESGKTIEEVAAEHGMRADELLDLYVNEAALRELLGDAVLRSGRFRTEGERVLLDGDGESSLLLTGTELHMQDGKLGELVFLRK